MSTLSTGYPSWQDYKWPPWKVRSRQSDILPGKLTAIRFSTTCSPPTFQETPFLLHILFRHPSSTLQAFEPRNLTITDTPQASEPETSQAPLRASRSSSSTSSDQHRGAAATVLGESHILSRGNCLRYETGTGRWQRKILTAGDPTEQVLDFSMPIFSQ